MTDLIERLNQILCAVTPTGYGQDIRDAITELDRLRTECNALRAALQICAEDLYSDPYYVVCRLCGGKGDEFADCHKPGCLAVEGERD